MRVGKLCIGIGAGFGLLVVLGVLLAGPALAQPNSGEAWDVTSEMSVPGMPRIAGMELPVITQQTCNAIGSNVPPVADNFGQCEIYDVKRTANGFTWQQRCEGDKQSAGELTFDGRHAFHGATTMTANGRTILTKLSGRRVGACDAAEAQRQRAAAKEAQAQRVVAAKERAAKRDEEGRATMCASAIDQVMFEVFQPDSPYYPMYRCQAKHKADLCRRLQTMEGATTLNSRGGSLDRAAQFCGADSEQLRASLCQVAEKQESLGFLTANNCVAKGYGKAIVKRECAGRAYTSQWSPKYREFCATLERETLLQSANDRNGSGSAAPAAQIEGRSGEAPQETAAAKGKQLLKNLFGK